MKLRNCHLGKAVKVVDVGKRPESLKNRTYVWIVFFGPFRFMRDMHVMRSSLFNCLFIGVINN